MTEKELSRLRRQDLLELLILQSKEVIELNRKLVEQEVQISALEESVSRQKARLNELQGRLESREDLIADLVRRLEGPAKPPEQREGQSG